jgi:transposase
MGRKSKHIKKLTEEQKSSLKKGYTHGKSPIYRRRCQSILLSNEGKTVKELSSFFGIGEHSIREWLKLWEKHESIQNLKLKAGRGRKPKLKPEETKHVQTVKTLISNEPRNLNRVTAQIDVELGIKVSKKTLKRFLKNLNTDGNAFDVG